MKIIPIAIGLLVLSAHLHGADGPRTTDDGTDAARRWGPYFLGHESEPSMDYGGRVMTSLHTGVSDLGSILTRRFPYVAPAYEVPLALLVSTMQHEIHGHGSRAREYNLKPSYGFGLDFSAYTTIDRNPRNIEQLATLAAGGTEATAIQARRILLDLCRPGTLPASTVPLMWLSKLDLSLYIAVTSRPRATDDQSGSDHETSFIEEFENGNDIAIYLVTRQAARRQADPTDVWQRNYEIDFDDPILQTNYRQVQDVAIWNALDPMMWAAMFFYVKEHAIRGKRTIPTPALPFNERFAFTMGTRGAIGPQSVSRFLDLYLLTPSAVFSIYGRDLRSADQTTYGFGGGIHRMTPSALPLKASLSGDIWDFPAGPEDIYEGVGWNVSGEIEFPVHTTMGLALKAGYKNKGYFPGTPTDAGAYMGGGVTARF